jgi:tryptophan 2-monooxygenase
MGIHKGDDKFEAVPGPALTSRIPLWKLAYPNTADFNFNYWRLLTQAENSAIGENKNPGLREANIVAGIAGLTAARELFRSGFANIDIFEADRRLGGRIYSIPVAGQRTVYEMGAMRMPFFDTPDKLNSVLGYYACTVRTRNPQSFLFSCPGRSVGARGS